MIRIFLLIGILLYHQSSIFFVFAVGDSLPSHDVSSPTYDGNCAGFDQGDSVSDYILNSWPWVFSPQQSFTPGPPQWTNLSLWNGNSQPLYAPRYGSTLSFKPATTYNGPLNSGPLPFNDWVLQDSILLMGGLSVQFNKTTAITNNIYLGK